jgi:alpha-glucosidase (family GH31 glycosyl hydrolase)
LNKIYQLNTSPLCKQDSIVRGDKYRFTILTPYLIRMEYDEDGNFLDHATQAVLCRDFDKPRFRVQDSLNSLEIITEAVHIFYDKNRFSENGLSIKVFANLTYPSTWHYSDSVDDLSGTARTLDEADGAITLDHGLLSKHGFALYDDSESFLLMEDGWIKPRRKGTVDLYFFGYGRNYKLCLKDFYRLTGETPLLPKFALGNWWSRFYRYTEETYRELIKRFENEKIPFTVSVMDMDWHLVSIDPKYGSGWTGYTWNRDLFSDPESFLTWLHDNGLHITLNVHPADGVRAHEEMYTRMAMELGIDVEKEEPIQFDVTNKEFLKAYFTYIHHENEKRGVDFWWVDWQQGNRSKLVGLDPLWMLNHFHFLDNQRNGKRGLILSRYAGIGSHRYPIGFSGDSIISWESLDFQPYFTATASNVGYGWWSHDIGGHMLGVKNDELATRWIQFGVFSPIMRLHSSGSIFNGKEPWNYDKNSQEIMKRFLRLRHQMIPYLYSMNARSSFYGEPLIQPMYYNYPERNEAYQVRNQYYFGSEMIVAPITSEMDKNLRLAKTKVWLPDGIFIDFFTGMIYNGNRWMELYRGLKEIPVLAKAGGIVPLYKNEYDGNHLDNPKELEIRIFAGDDGNYCLYEDDGESLLYKQGSYVTTEMNLQWNKDYVFEIEGSKGSLDLIPEKRNYLLKFVGFKDCTNITVKSGEKQIPFVRFYNDRMNEMELQIQEIEVLNGVTIQFGEKLELAINKVEQILFELLNNAQIEFKCKEQIYYLIKSSSDISKIITELNTLDLNKNLFGALCEILLAI